MFDLDSEWFDCVFDVVVNGNVVSGGVLFDECVRVAAENKVLLEFLRSSGIRDDVLVREEARYRRFLRGFRLVARALEGLDFVFIKLYKPVVYVPADIDVLVPRDVVWMAYSRLRDFGFELEVVEPYTVTVTRGGVIVDLYVHPTLGGVIYLDGSKLLELVRYVDFGGLEVPVLEGYAEALLAVGHAVYKEKLYTLNDYMVLREWLSKKTLDLAVEMGSLSAVREAVWINELVDAGRLVLPYKIPVPRWLSLLGGKVFHDRLTRGTLPNLLKVLNDPQVGDLVLSKLTRASY